jgi:DNA-binding LacI/PurR family transcriptional regulator
LSSEVTLRQIADELGCSAMTVSRALNGYPHVSKKTKERIEKKARSMGYTPNNVAKSLVARKTNTIGVVIPEISHAFFPEVVRGIEEATHQYNYQLFLTNADEQFEREKKVINALWSKRVDGMLISSSLQTDDYSFYEEIIKNGPEVVFFDRCIENLEVSCVAVQDRISSNKITEHLINQHGYKKIAYLSGNPVAIGPKRLLGYRDAMQAHDLSEQVIEAGYQEEKGFEAMQKLLNLPERQRPRAVVAVNDPCAIGAMRAIKAAGLRIPEDIAIVGFTDEVRAPLLNPPLTTIHQPAYELGKRAAKKLISTIENEDEPVENIELLTNLKIRSSCGCAMNDG